MTTRIAFMSTTLLILLMTGAAIEAQEADIRQDDRSSRIQVKLVGQALIKRDLRPIAPGSVTQAREYLAGADIVFTNLEGTVAPADAADTPRSPTAAYGPPALLDCLKDMGFNMLSLANNHAWDLQEAGIATTRQAVAEGGFTHAGTGRNAAEALAPGYRETPAGSVALIAMASGAVQLTPDTWAGPDKPGVNFLALGPDGELDARQRLEILNAVREAAARADLVVVYHHNHYWGENRGVDGPPGRELRIDRFETPAWMERWARELVDVGADLYVVHGNPALHGVEIYKERLILYGLGNYIFHTRGGLDRYGPLAWYSVVADAQFEDGRLTALGFRPLVLAMDGDARGAPYLAQGGEASAILGRLEDLSSRYGTRMRIDGESAEVLFNEP